MKQRGWNAWSLAGGLCLTFAAGCNASSSNSSSGDEPDGSVGNSTSGNSSGGSGPGGGVATTGAPGNSGGGSGPGGGVATTGNSATSGGTTAGNIVDAATAQALCETWFNRLTSCGLATEGSFGCNDAFGLPTAMCVFECGSVGTCADLEELQCHDVDLLNNSVATCVANCLELSDGMVTCDNGTAIPEEWLCDADDDCGDASDEAACPSPFTCSDGLVLPGGYRCDDDPDCADGGDEVDCPEMAELACPETPAPSPSP